MGQHGPGWWNLGQPVLEARLVTVADDHGPDPANIGLNGILGEAGALGDLVGVNKSIELRDVEIGPLGQVRRHPAQPIGEMLQIAVRVTVDRPVAN